VHLFLQFGESGGVGGLVLLEELEDLLDSLTAELSADGVQVVTFVLPEIELFCGVGVHSFLESVLWVLLQDMLDLSAPLDDSVFQDEGLVLRRGLLGGGHITWGQGEDGAAFDETDGDHGVGKEAVELVHEVLGHEVTPADLVEGITQDGHEDSLADREKILKNGLVQLHKDDVLGDPIGEWVLSGVRIGHRLDNKEGLLPLSLLIQVRWVNADRHVLRTELLDEDEWLSAFEYFKSGLVIIVLEDLNDTVVLALLHGEVSDRVLDNILLIGQFL
jgi:hypothetical protein